MGLFSVKSFRDFFEQLNKKLQSNHSNERKPINAEVVQVADESAFLDPVTETAEIQRMINSHNLSFKNPQLNRTKSPFAALRIYRTVFYTGYLISSADAAMLVTKVLDPMLPHGLLEANDLKYMANNILISPRPATKSLLDKVGGIGKKISWRVIGVSAFENRIWAARLAPVSPAEKYHTDNSEPVVVLAVRKGTRPNDATKIQHWNPVPFEGTVNFETVVGEKTVLRIEEDNTQEGDEWGESQFSSSHNRGKKRRRHERDDENNSHDTPEWVYFRQQRIRRNGGGGDDGPHKRGGLGRGGRGGRGGGWGRNRGSGRGRGRGGRDASGAHLNYYRSLDDSGEFKFGVDEKSNAVAHGTISEMNY